MPKQKSTPTRKTKGKGEGKKKKGKLIATRLARRRLTPTLTLTRSLDPNAPKRGLSAYMFFANDQRDNVREENPGIAFGTQTHPVALIRSPAVANHLLAP